MTSPSGIHENADAFVAASARATWAETSPAATIAAPLRRALADVPPTPQATNSSILPRIEQVGDSVRLLPNAGERYKRVRSLGVGSMGDVALVEDRDIGRPVALKRLVSSEPNPAKLARFIDEVHTVGRLEHPNIVPIHDVGIDEDGRYFFVMKYVDGETLEEVIRKLRAGDPDAHAKYPLRRRMEIFIALLRALQYAHDSNIIHRDLKPANVMIGRFGEVMLMDWGIAREVGAKDRPPGESEACAASPSASADLAGSQRASSTVTAELIGTPLYMSPEQALAQNDGLDTRSDLYSACVVFHEFLCLRHRFEGVQPLPALLTRIISTEPPKRRKMVIRHPAQKEQIPFELTHYLRRGLQIDPKRRFQSAGEMIEELQAILDGRCRVSCATTLLKRVASTPAHFVDRHRPLAIVIMYGAPLAGLIWLVYAISKWAIR